VSFDPQTQGALSGTLTVSSNAPVLQIPLSGTGAQAVQHSISLSWSPSTSQVIGYFIYRGTASGGPYSKIESSIDSSTSYVDTSVADGQIYYYVVTSVDSSNVESAYSNQVAVTIPSS
jgi:fibronectin type 3 domain-containing protein